MNTNRTAIILEMPEGELEKREDVFVRQVEDRALPALRVLAEQQKANSRELPEIGIEVWIAFRNQL